MSCFKVRNPVTLAPKFNEENHDFCTLSFLLLISVVSAALDPSSEELFADLESDLKGLKVSETKPVESSEPVATDAKLSSDEGDAFGFSNDPSHADSQTGPDQEINSPSDPHHSAFFLQNCLRFRLLSSPEISDDHLFHLCMEAMREPQIGPELPVIVTLAANALAVGRFELYKQLMDEMRDKVYDLKYGQTPMSLEASLLFELSQIPHFTEVAGKSPEFDQILDTVISQKPPYKVKNLRLYSMNLPFFMALGQKTTFESPAFSCIALDRIKRRYGLTVEDVRPAVRRMMKKKMAINPPDSAVMDFPHIVELLAEAAKKN